MKILCIKDTDIEGYWDWALGEAAERIIDEDFTHIMDSIGNILKVEIVVVPPKGDVCVSIGEQIN